MLTARGSEYSLVRLRSDLKAAGFERSDLYILFAQLLTFASNPDRPGSALNAATTDQQTKKPAFFFSCHRWAFWPR
jgi:hypothetical protein